MIATPGAYGPDGTEAIPVTLLGATGSVGQRMVRLLDGHPWFRLERVVASARSAGRRYRDAVDWVQDAPIPGGAADLIVEEADPGRAGVLAFSALDASVAAEVEDSFARSGALVVSNARSHRMRTDVPLLVPEVNADHLELMRRQPYAGGIITNPNCSTIGLTMALGPLHRAFGVRRVSVVTLQAVSGAGLPGPGAMSMLGNVVPYIAGEEEKLERETRKILGTCEGDHVREADVAVSAQCTRVPVVDGHTLCVSVELGGDPSPEQAVEAWRAFAPPQDVAGLPSAAARTVRVVDDVAGPQPRLHAGYDAGMSVLVGRVRRCPLLGLRFVALSHNTVRGAAGGTLLCAELAVVRGLVPEGTGP